MSQTKEATGLLTQIQTGAVPWTTLAGVMGAILLGVFIVFGIGFAGPEVIHNAAHDLRHGLAFPCH